ncbi:MAG: phenylalanine--tRNA ligase subunit beta [Clostridiales bacterium]|nr:MAG: phenylalanine--tRNA ligase subunit beta [Clostridiales bacterium]
MLVPLKWLNEYVKVADIDLKTYESAMIMSGSNTEGVHPVLDGVSNVVVGQIKSIAAHPNADKLVVCQCDVGAEALLQIVTGATNMVEGDYVAVALDNSTITGGKVIKAGDLRGERSEGMMCSYQELGFSDKVIAKSMLDGLIVFKDAKPLGQPIGEALDLDDYVVDFEITPNRPDCLSMIGMARETAVTFGRDYKYPNTSIANAVGEITGRATVTIDAPDKCARYACRLIEDVKIEPSPIWLQTRLMKAGMRPINNIVDITNYVLLEYGQPIHAFDLDCLAGGQIVVRNAKAGEVIKTLDDVERNLTAEMLVVADAEKAQAIAGIMGGAHSEVSATTKRLLIEVANFDKTNIRETSRVLGLRSESSSRFEKGISPELVPAALNRVCHLIEQLAAGTVVGGAIDEYPRPQQAATVDVRVRRINSLIGVKLSADEMHKMLLSLGCKVKLNSEILQVEAPFYRLDLTKEIDYCEEIARLYGYDKLPMTQPRDHIIGKLTARQRFSQSVHSRMIGYGLSEIVTYSFIGPSVIDALNDSFNSAIKQNVVIRNPLGEEYSVMRPSMIPGMLQVVARNLNRQIDSVALFETGNVFTAAAEVDGEPRETEKLIVAIADEAKGYFDLKWVVDSLLVAFNIDGVSYHADRTHATYHPGRCAKLTLNGEYLGHVGQIHPTVQTAFGVPKAVYVAELNLDKLYANYNADIVYKQLPKYPSSSMDAAFVVDAQVTHRDMVTAIEKFGGEYLVAVELFDVYSGDQVADDKKSMAYKLTFRNDQRTLVDEDIKQAFEAIRTGLEASLQATLR